MENGSPQLMSKATLKTPYKTNTYYMWYLLMRCSLINHVIITDEMCHQHYFSSTSLSCHTFSRIFHKRPHLLVRENVNEQTTNEEMTVFFYLMQKNDELVALKRVMKKQRWYFIQLTRMCGNTVSFVHSSISVT